MTIQREDLVAAASVGILQYRQIDPLLIYLLQRDVCSHREAMLEQKTAAYVRGRVFRFLTYLVIALGVITASLFAVMFGMRANLDLIVDANTGSLIAVAALCALGIALWFTRKQFGVAVRMLVAFLIALVPVGVFALQNVVH
jgi:hypothetical protein